MEPAREPLKKVNNNLINKAIRGTRIRKQEEEPDGGYVC